MHLNFNGFIKVTNTIEVNIEYSGISVQSSSTNTANNLISITSLSPAMASDSVVSPPNYTISTPGENSITVEHNGSIGKIKQGSYYSLDLPSESPQNAQYYTIIASYPGVGPSEGFTNYLPLSGTANGYTWLLTQSNIITSYNDLLNFFLGNGNNSSIFNSTTNTLASNYNALNTTTSSNEGFQSIKIHLNTLIATSISATGTNSCSSMLTTTCTLTGSVSTPIFGFPLAYSIPVGGKSLIYYITLVNNIDNKGQASLNPAFQIITLNVNGL